MISREKSFNMANFINLISTKFKTRHIRTDVVLVFVFAFNVLFWGLKTSKIKHDFTITPYPPSKFQKMILSLGDDALLYRFFATRLQFAGDTYGETIPLKNYDYKKLEKWFYSLDELDSISEYVPAIAGFYYAFSQNPQDNKYIVPYLVDFGRRDPNKNWRWLFTASNLAKDKLKDYKLAMQLADEIIDIKNSEIPYWAKLSAVFIAKDHDPCSIARLVQKLSKSDVEDLMKDQIFSSKDNEHNFLLNALLKNIDKVTNDPKLLEKCRNEVSK